jgi:hypothetical protein
MKKFSLIFLLVLYLSACEKTVVIDIPRRDPRLVLSGILEKDSTIGVFVSKTRYILDPSDHTQQQYLIATARPVIYENGVAVDTLVYDPADYSYRSMLGTKILGGNNYGIKVSTPGFSEAEAFTSVPSQSMIASVQRVRDARVDGNGIHQDEITLKLNDPAERNFYLIQIYGSAWGGMNGMPVYCVGTTDKDIESIGYNDPMASGECLDGGRLLMKDDHFNGREKQVVFYVESGSLQDIYDPVTNRTWRPYILVKRITEDYFRFLKTLDVYETTGDNPFAEPANVFTNVRNGFGIFTAYTSASDTLR